MAEESTLARPYAQAAFDLAKAQGNLKSWSEMLRGVAGVVTNPALQAVLGNPRVGKGRLATLVSDVCGDRLNQHGRNLVMLLVENGRLTLIPEILAVFEELRAEEEATIQAEVVSAFDLSADQQAQIAAALKKRLGREVTVTSKTNPDLLGGAIIRAGDLVIDGSATGHLGKLGSALSG